MSDGRRELEAGEWRRLSLFSSCGREERGAVGGGASWSTLRRMGPIMATCHQKFARLIRAFHPRPG